jgi:SAM-dependent methyltransferase
MSTSSPARPGYTGRLRSRQSGLPSGVLGRIFGRAMEGATARANDRALAMVDLSRPRTILEVGFGQGRTAAVLVRAGHRVIGVDASPTMVEQATARNRAACRDGRATLLCGDGIVIPFPDDSADAAIVVHTVYFLPDLAATVVEIARVVRPGGTLVIACRTSDTPHPRWMDPEVYRIPAAAHLVEVVEAAGFEMVEHRYDDAAEPEVHVLSARLLASAP